jgi:hypothetical protein
MNPQARRYPIGVFDAIRILGQTATTPVRRLVSNPQKAITWDGVEPNVSEAERLWILIPASLFAARALASTSFAETSHSDQSSLSRPWPAPVRHRQSEPRTLITAVQFLVRISNISPHEWASRGGADFQCDDAFEVRYSRRATVSCIGLSMSARSVRRQAEFFPTAIEPVVADIKRPGPACSQSMLRPAPF